MEAGKKRLSGDTECNANTDEVQHLKKENDNLKKAIADLYLHNESEKKFNRLGLSPKRTKYMRFTQSDKYGCLYILISRR